MVVLIMTHGIELYGNNHAIVLRSASPLHERDGDSLKRKLSLLSLLSFPNPTPSEHATRSQRTGSSQAPGFQVQTQGCPSELHCWSIGQLGQRGAKKELGEGWAVGETGTGGSAP